MKPLFELPELLNLGGDVFSSILSAETKLGPGSGCGGGCISGCCSGCYTGGGGGASVGDEDPPVG